MAKASKKPATTGQKAKSAGATKPKQSANGSKKDQEARLATEHEAFYKANKARIDDALAKCVKHFGDDEHDIVRAVGRMLHGYYRNKRARIPMGGLLAQ